MEKKRNLWVIPTDKPSRLHLGNSGLVLCDLNYSSNTINSQHIYITSDEEIKEGDWFYLDDAIIVTKYINVKPDKEAQKIILTTNQDLIKDGVQAIDDTFLEWFVKNPSCEEVEVEKQHQYHSSKEFYIDADYVNCSKQQYESIKEEIPTCPLRILYKIIIPKEEQKLINNCPKCGLDLVIRKSCTPICTDIDCGGIVLSNETLKEWQLKEEPKQDLEKEMFELEQQLDIPSSMRWYNSKPKQEITLEEVAERIAMTKDWDFESSEGNGYYDYVEGFTEGAKWQQEKMYSDMQEYTEFCIRCYEKGLPYIIAEDWFEHFKNK